MSNPRNKKPLWPVGWVLLVIAVTGICFMLWPKEDNNVNLRRHRPFIYVNEYISWAGKALPDSNHINASVARTGLIKISDALAEIGGGARLIKKSELAFKVRMVKINAGLISRANHPIEDEHSAKAAFLICFDILSKLQKSAFPDLSLEIDKLEANISAIKKFLPVSEQKKEIGDTFKQIRLILISMSNYEQS